MNLILRNRDGFPVPVAFRSNGLDSSFERLINRLFDEVSDPASAQQSIASSPRINVMEHKKSYEVEAELPGVTKENVKITVDKRRISIEAEVKRASEQKEGEAAGCSERVTKKYARDFILNEEIDDALVTAKLENGILTLSLPKKEAAQPKQITVQ